MEYDIKVWMDEDGDVVCTALTPMGQDFVRMLFPGTQGTEIVEILIEPDDFIARVGKELNVAFISPETGKTYNMRDKFLH